MWSLYVTRPQVNGVLLSGHNTALALELSSPLLSRGTRRGKAGRNKKDPGLDSAEDRGLGINH